MIITQGKIRFVTYFYLSNRCRKVDITLDVLVSQNVLAMIHIVQQIMSYMYKKAIQFLFLHVKFYLSTERSI